MQDWGITKVSVSRREIKINGYISLVTVSRTARGLRDMQCHNLNPILVFIQNSRGGCASSGQMIFGILRSAPAPIYTIVEQFAWSAAFYIFLAGEKRIMFRKARVGPHSVAITHNKDVACDAVGLHGDIEYVNKFNEKLFAIISSVISMPREEIANACFQKKIFSARDALRVGIATDLASAKTFYKPRGSHSASRKN